jgi:imidazoleglycerol phosphate synthase glutamine amidotransferase subunit HisH
MPKVHLLDYVAGNIRSLVNAIEKLGYEVDWIRSPEDVPRAEVCGPPPRNRFLRDGASHPDTCHM